MLFDFLDAEQLTQNEASEKLENLHPVLDEIEGYYVLGPKSKATNVFCMSVTIAAARNLTKVFLAVIYTVFHDS